MLNNEAVKSAKLKTTLILAMSACALIALVVLMLKGDNGPEYISDKPPVEENLKFEVDSFLGRAVRFGFESEYVEEYISSYVKKYVIQTPDEFNSVHLTVNTNESEITSYTLSIHLYKTELEKELDNVEYDNNQTCIRKNYEAISFFDKWNNALLRAFDKEAELSDAQLKFAAQLLRKACDEKQTQNETVGTKDAYAVYEELGDYDVLSFSVSK